MFVDYENEMISVQAHKASGFMHKVYAWMCAGLLTSALVSYVLLSELWLIELLLSSKLVFYMLFGAQLGMVIYLQAALHTLSYQRAKILFVGYAALVGVTLSPLLLIYTHASVAYTFLAAAGMFGGMAVYGYVTQEDLTQFRNIFMMGLFGLIVARVTNMFIGGDNMDYYITLAGVVLFALLTAYDVQRIKMMSQQMLMHQDEHTGNKVALVCALALYLNFLNIFIKLLRLTGKRRD
jgi:hypothetical protein